MDQTGQSEDDTGQGKVGQEGNTQHVLQQCIDLIHAEHAGKTVTELRGLLGDAVEARGHPRPPRTWLDAVCGEIADGRRYITGTHAGGGPVELEH